MSVQSESGRLDYSNSDHAPKGQRMAGEVVQMPSTNTLQKSMPGAAGQAANERAARELSAGQRARDMTGVSDEFLRRKLEQLGE